MKSTLKTIGLLTIIPLIICLIFFSNIKGYFRFKHYCEAEGGLRVYEKLERNMGWWAKDKNYAQIAALVNGVGFVRYKDENGNLFDLRYLGGNSQDDNSFETLPANEINNLIYRFEYINGNLPNEIRLGRSGFEISDYTSNKILARFYMFGYANFNRDRTLLDMRSSTGCFNENGNHFGDLPRSLEELSRAFKP